MRVTKTQGVLAREENETESYFFQNGHGDVVSRVIGETSQIHMTMTHTAQKNSLTQPIQIRLDTAENILMQKADWYICGIGTMIHQSGALLVKTLRKVE